MRKQNRSIPPQPKPDNRLINSVIRSRRCKRPNAQKAGLHVSAAFIPGEDPREFDQILAELMGSWKPAGPDLRDALRVLAEYKFHLRRLKKYVQTELYVNTFNPRHPGFDEVWGFVVFIHHLRSDPETAFDNHAAKYLRRDKIDALEQRFPRENYQLASQWAEAVTAELLSAATPAKVDLEAPGPGYRAAEVEAAARKWRTDQQVVGSITYARDLLEYEAKETERLNALIVKQTKFCAQLKAWEEAEEARNKN